MEAKTINFEDLNTDELFIIDKGALCVKLGAMAKAFSISEELDAKVKENLAYVGEIGTLEFLNAFVQLMTRHNLIISDISDVLLRHPGFVGYTNVHKGVYILPSASCYYAVFASGHEDLVRKLLKLPADQVDGVIRHKECTNITRARRVFTTDVSDNGIPYVEYSAYVQFDKDKGAPMLDELIEECVTAKPRPTNDWAIIGAIQELMTKLKAELEELEEYCEDVTARNME